MLSSLTGWPLWLVVAGGRTADFYLLPKPTSELRHVDTIVNEEANLREQDRVSDRPGRSFDSVGSGRHSMEPATTQKRADENRFAADLVSRIARGDNDNEFAQFAIIAAPRMLGAIRASLPAPLRSKVRFEVPKDLSQSTTDQLRREIGEHLMPAG